MKKCLSNNILTVIFILISLLVPAAQAQIGAVTGSNSPSQVTITSTGHSFIQWSIIENVANPGPVSVSSSSGVFFAPDNSILGTVNQSLQANRNVAIAGATTFTFNESLIVPQSIIRQAQKKGFGTFAYARQFKDFPDNNIKSGSVTFSITGSNASGELSVRRVEMEFDDGRISEVLDLNTDLQAHAVLSYNGTGLLDYSWQVASPPSTQGQAIFVTMNTQRQYLLAGQRVVLQSPKLPTSRNGEYLVRLRINSPTAAFNLPVLRYAINNSRQSNLMISPLLVEHPAQDVMLTPDTLFVWQAVSMATAYQLEIYTRPIRDTDLPGDSSKPPITGVLIPAKDTQLKVDNLPRAHLMPGNTYYWRVIALTEKGNVIARSDFRRIKF